MKIKATKPALARTLVTVLALNSLFLIANGVFMLIEPRAWYLAIPGVKFTGGFNQHFIRDIGLIQMLLGVAFVVGILRPRVRLELWATATAWLVAHSLFHFWEVAVGICGSYSIIQDFPGVTLPALIGVTATTWAWSAEHPSNYAFSASREQSQDHPEAAGKAHS